MRFIEQKKCCSHGQFPYHRYIYFTLYIHDSNLQTSNEIKHSSHHPKRVTLRNSKINTDGFAIFTSDVLFKFYLCDTTCHTSTKRIDFDILNCF